MKEGELSVSQRELHRMHVVRLTIEGRERGDQTLDYEIRSSSSSRQPIACHHIRL
jgi:hypothetical protein